MSLIDVRPREETITDKADKIRMKLADVVGIAEIRLHEIRSLVSRYGRANIAAELGNDAAALLTTYAKLKEAIETAKETTVEDMPD